MDFKQALNEALDVLNNGSDEFCVGVYYDDNWADNALVMFMEYGEYKHMHEVMHILHAELSNRMGWPVSICHNNPEDEIVLIHSSQQDSALFDPDTCCRDKVDQCLGFLKTRQGYRSDIRALAVCAERIAEHSDSQTPEDVLKCIDWNYDPMAQMLGYMMDNETPK